MKILMNALLVCSAALFVGCGKEVDRHEHGHHHGHGAHGPNGGELLEIGDHLAHLELLHDADDKSVTLHLLGPDAKQAIPFDAPPKLNLIVDGNPLQLEMTGSNSTYTVIHKSFSGQLEGRVALRFDQKNYQITITHAHHHH